MMNRDVDEIIIRVYARQHALRNAKMKLSSFTGLKLHHFTGSLDNSEEAAARGGNNNGSSCPSPIKYRIYTSASGGDLTSGQLLTTTRMKTSTSVASVRQEESKIDGEMQVDSEGVISLPDCEEGDNILFLVGCSPVTLKQEDAILHKVYAIY